MEIRRRPCVTCVKASSDSDFCPLCISDEHFRELLPEITGNHEHLTREPTLPQTTIQDYRYINT